MIVNSKLRGAPDATLPETSTAPTPQSWPTGLSAKIVLVVVTAACVVSLTTVLSHVVVPVFRIVTVTIAVLPSSILMGTLEYDTNAELSPPFAAPAVNAMAKNSPATAEWRNAARRVLSALETNVRSPASDSLNHDSSTAKTAQRPAAPPAQAKASVSTIAGAGRPGSFTYSRDSPVTVSTTSIR